MSKLPKVFQRKDYGEMSYNRAVTAGHYIGKIVESDYVENSSKNGHILKLKVSLQNKKVKGTIIYRFLNLDNPSEKAVEIANEEFGTILDACGKKKIKDSKALHNIMMKIDVGIQSASGNYPDSNTILMYKPLEPDDKFDDDEDEDDELDEEELEEADEEEDEEEDEDDEVNPDDVIKLAKKFKSENDLKSLKKLLAEYDIEKISQIKTLSEDDLEALAEDINDEM